MDERNKTVTFNGELKRLTKKEFDILVVLMRHSGEVLSREKILQEVWPKDTYVLERTVDVHIARIRRKIGEEAAHYIVQRTGFG